MNILVLDSNHPILIESLKQNGHTILKDYTSTYEEVLPQLQNVEGLIIRSRIPLDKNLMEHAPNLKFIARVGAGLENIDLEFAQEKGIKVLSASEGNRDSLAEHSMGMLLMLLHRLKIADAELRQGIWRREENRGDELMGKTIGIIGYGIQGKAFAKRLKGFEVEVICHDILEKVGDENARQVSLAEFFEKADVVSLHVPLTPLTYQMFNAHFIAQFKKDFYLLNTSRGQCVRTQDLNDALETGKIKGACLDVFEFEKSSFENLENTDPEFKRLLSFSNVILSPHIAGWSIQSKEKLATIIAEKINSL